MTTERRWCLASAFLLLAATGCNSGGSAVGERKAAATAPLGPQSLAVPTVARSLDPELALRTLDGGIQTRRRQLAKPGRSWFRDWQLQSQLVEALLLRAHLLGTVADYDEALERARDIAARHGARRPSSRLLEARALASLHRFDEASAILDALAEAGVPAAEIRPHRATLALARGDAGTALDLLAAQRQRGTRVGDVTTQAIALADLGRTDAAERAFRHALSGNLKGDPVPVARVWFQQGRMWERHDNPALARRYYLLALERLPFYAPLVAHLSALESQMGQTETAIERMRAVVVRSQDPEHAGLLATLLESKGHTDEATRWREQADAGYDRLLAAHPLAFADHAARYYLGTGRSSKALGLATTNLENRESDEALALYLDAAKAAQAGSVPAATTCEVATSAARRVNGSAYLYFAASRALSGCGLDAASASALALAKGAPRSR